VANNEPLLGGEERTVVKNNDQRRVPKIIIVSPVILSEFHPFLLESPSYESRFDQLQSAKCFACLPRLCVNCIVQFGPVCSFQTKERKIKTNGGRPSIHQESIDERISEIGLVQVYISMEM
jgi:hypothetical protein